MKILCKNKHWKLNEDYDINKILYLFIDRPTRINSWNDFIWRNNKGKFHRKYDLPSYICNDGGYVYWYKNQSFHRENNKPAVICKNGYKEHWKNGKRK